MNDNVSRVGKNPSMALWDDINDAVTKAIADLGYDNVCMGMVHWVPESGMGVANMTIALRRAAPGGEATPLPPKQVGHG